MHAVAQRIADSGAKVTVVAGRGDSLPRQAWSGDVRVIRIGGQFTLYPLTLLWLLKNRREIDAVIDCMNGIPFLSPLVVKRGTPIVSLVHHVHRSQFPLFLPFPLAAVGRALESHVARWVYGHRPILAVSPSTREMLVGLGRRGPVFMAPNGPPEWDSGRRPFDRTPQPSISVVSRLVPSKRLELMLHAVRDVLGFAPDLKVDIVGDGSLRAELERLAEELGLAKVVSFHGRVDDRRREELVSSSWLTLNTSMCEGWGLNIIEANALGVPAVALDVPGIRDSVRPGETGWLAKDEESLSSVLTVALDVLSDSELAAGFSRRAQRWAAGFDWDITVSRILEVLEAERDRLARPHGPATRRVESADVLRLDAPQSAYGRISRSVRQTDVVSMTDGHLVAFLYGASPKDRGVIAERLKLDREVRVSLASNRDLVLSNRRVPGRTESETGHLRAEGAAGAI